MNATELLGAIGVAADQGRWSYGYKIRGEGRRIEILDASTNATPNESTTNWIAISRRVDGAERHLYWDIALRTMDARDVMAFCLAAEHGERFSAEGDQVPEEYTFEWEGMAIHNAFADESYGEWEGKQVEGSPLADDGRVIEVTPPTQKEWADAYVAWRDQLADRLVSSVPAPR